MDPLQYQVVASDSQLLRRVPGDPAAFEEFYRRHVGRVTAFAARRCSSAADVADTVSATFLAALRSAPSFNERKGSPEAWLLGIASHEVIALHRRSSRQDEIARRVAGSELLQPEDTERLEAQIDAERLAPQVARALSKASRAEREVFLLVARDGLSPSEAATVLGIAPVAARVRLSRARRRLRIELGKEPPAGPVATPALKEHS